MIKLNGNYDRCRQTGHSEVCQEEVEIVMIILFYD